MRRNKLCKRVLSVTLATVLALGSPIAMGPSGAVGPTTAKAAGTELIYENTFEADTETGGPGGTVVGGGKVEDSKDVNHGKVFHNATGGKRVNYYKLPNDVFSENQEKIANNEGVTISFEVNKADEDDGINYPAFTAYGGDTEGKDNGYPMLAVQTRGVMSYNSNGFSDFTDSENINSVNKQSIEYLNDKQWHTVTAVISKSKGYFYVDGRVVNEWNTQSIVNGDAVSASDNSGFLNSGIGALTHICLGGNQAWNWNDNDPGYMFDNVKIYAGALSQDQIIEQVLPSIESITVTPENPTVENVYYYASEKDREDGKESGSELGELQLNASVTPSNAYSDITWQLTNKDQEKIASVDSDTGLVKMLDASEIDESTDIVVTAKGRTGKAQDFTVKATLEKRVVESVTDIDVPTDTVPLYAYLDASGTPQIGAMIDGDSLIKVIPETATVKDVIMTSADGKISIDPETNMITASEAGEAEVTVTSVSNKDISKTFKIDVKNEYGGFGTGMIENSTYPTWVDGAGNLGSGYQKVSGNFDIEYDFHTKSYTENATPENFAVAVKDVNNNLEARFRADGCINVSDIPLLEGVTNNWDTITINTTAWTNSATDWTPWLEDMKKGANVKVRITRKSDNLYVTYDITADSGNKYSRSAVTKIVEKAGDELLVCIGGENCECTNVKVAITTQDIQLGTGASQELKVSDILPVDVTEEVKISPDLGEDGVVQVTPGVDKVTFKGLKNGTTTVTVTDPTSRLSFDCKVTVSDIAATSIEIEKEVTLKKGDTKKLTTTIKPDAAANQTVTWTSSDPKVATVEDGTITAVAAGTATITAAVGAVSATCTVTVTDETAAPGETDTPGGSTSGTAIAVESVTLDKPTAELEIGASTTLTATVKPDNASNKDVTWSTSDAKVATVDETGKVTAVAAGTATITVTSKSNEKAVATCTITVKAPASGDNNDDNNNGNVSDNNNDNNNSDNNNDSNNNSGSDNSSDAKEPEATTATVTNTSGVKETVKTTEDGTATVTKVKSSKKSVTVSSTVKVKGVKYTVTVVAANAFKSCKNVTKITLPATVKKFNKKAFTGAKKVKTIVVKSKKAITVKKGAFKGLKTKKITIKAGKMSKKQLKKFKKSLKKAGFKGKVKKK